MQLLFTYFICATTVVITLYYFFCDHDFFVLTFSHFASDQIPLLNMRSKIPHFVKYMDKNKIWILQFCFGSYEFFMNTCTLSHYECKGRGNG